MAVTINGTSGITTPGLSSSANVTLAGASVKLLNNSANPVVQQTGSVLQVVQVTSTTQVTTTSTSMTTSGISASITPTSSTSKILVVINANMFNGSTGGMGISIARNGSVVWNPSANDGSGYYGIYVNAPLRALSSITYLDSPATTSSTTYALYFAARANTVYLNETGSTSNGGTSITLMEIAA